MGTGAYLEQGLSPLPSPFGSLPAILMVTLCSTLKELLLVVLGDQIRVSCMQENHSTCCTPALALERGSWLLPADSLLFLSSHCTHPQCDFCVLPNWGLSSADSPQLQAQVPVWNMAPRSARVGCPIHPHTLWQTGRRQLSGGGLGCTSAVPWVLVPGGGPVCCPPRLVS